MDADIVATVLVIIFSVLFLSFFRKIITNISEINREE